MNALLFRPCHRLRAAVLLLGLAASAHVQALDPAAPGPELARSPERGDPVQRDLATAVNPQCPAALAGDAAAQAPCGQRTETDDAQQRADAWVATGVSLAAESALQAAQATAAAAEQVLAGRYQQLIDTTQKKQIMAIVQRLAPQYGVHPGLAYAVISAESNFNPQAISPKNAQGLMQLIPETAARFNITQPMDPEQNIRGGLSYLRWLLAYFQGNVSLVVAAYNAGEGAVNRHKGVPPFPETQGYVRRIQEVFQLQHHPFDARITAPAPEWPRLVNRPRS